MERQKLVAMATSLSTSAPPSNTWFVGPIQAHDNRTQMASGSVQLFLDRRR